MDNLSYGTLGIRHFDQFSSPKNTYKNWEDLVADGTVVQCKKCQKWIWSMWHVDCYDTVTRKAKYDHMDQCGPCFFKDNE